MNMPEFPEDTWVEARYPPTTGQEHGDREAWPWLPGWVVSVCGPDEWQVCVQAPGTLPSSALRPQNRRPGHDPRGCLGRLCDRAADRR